MKKKAARKKSVTATRRRPAARKKSLSAPRKRARVQKVVRKRSGPALKPIGKITHYFPHVKAGVVKVTKGTLALGDTVHIKGHTTDFKQTVTSLQLDHRPIQKALKGQEVGIGVTSRVRQHDLVFKP